MTLHPNLFINFPGFLVTLPGMIFFEVSRTVVSTCSAGVVLFVIAIVAVKNDFAQARGIDKVAVLGNMCFAIPLAVFGAEHFAASKGISQIVPKFMPWHMFWTYFVGCALIAASLSIATKIQVRWSGLLIGIMFFIFVALMDLPATVKNPHNRIIWALLCRELSFGAGGWCFASLAMEGGRPQGKNWLFIVGRVIIGAAAMFYGFEHFLHPLNVPGVPLERFMPEWMPGRMVISYITGAILVVGGAAILLAKKTRMAASYLGGWLVLIVLLIYGPILIVALRDPSTGEKVEGINYFFDTLLYAGTVLALAAASPRSEQNPG
jgi:uncharacterized membrane protein